MFDSINLELSMKVFKKNDLSYIKQVVNKIFDHWAPLLNNRKSMSVLLWISDGSNILDYTGNLDEVIEWDYFMGCAKMETLKEGEDRDVDLHKKNVLYRKELPVVTHRTIKNIVAVIKEEGSRRYPDAKITVGIPFDIGPEFARSKFKYERHPEICTGSGEGVHTFINSYGNLAGDNYPYAGFPNGIPEGTPFGTFLGKQTQIYLHDLNMDYLWLSNGVGFSATSWTATGEIFDGKKFHTEKFEEVEEKVFSFWKAFRKECPNYTIYTRGTNFSAGIDYAVDAVGLHKIYNAGLNIVPPPNSPWAAINGNYGLELMGHMTRNCELPGKDFMFRYYLHDCWWVNSPWYDRYNGKPHDIYLPMALSRIDEEGKIQSANIMNIFTLDNTFGDMPDLCVYESMPHFMKAEKDSPDEAAPFVWVYPFREYTTTTSEQDLIKILSGDLFICRAISNGFPLSSIVSCDNFLKHDKEIYNRSVLVTPVPDAESPFEKDVLNYIDNGGKVLFYGSLDKASDTFIDVFGLEKSVNDDSATDVSRQQEYIVCQNAQVDINRDGVVPNKIFVREAVCNGMLNELRKNEYSQMTQDSIKITAGPYDLTAVYKNAAWYRAPLSLQSLDYDTKAKRDIDDPHTYMWGEVMLRKVLKHFGYEFSFSKSKADSLLPVIMLHRSDNAEFASVFAPDVTVETRLKFPLGAPIFIGYEVEIENGAAVYHFPKAEHAECRVYVEQQQGLVSVAEMPPVSAKFRRRIKVDGLEDATVRFFGESYCKDNITPKRHLEEDQFANVEGQIEKIIHSKEYGTYYEMIHVTGNITFCMPYPEE